MKERKTMIQKPVKRASLSEQVYRSLSDAIVSGQISPGAELKEQHLAKEMCVSATPVREAFRRLDSEGLVEIIPYQGVYVKKLDQKEISEAYACREALEHLAAEEYINKITQADIDKLYDCVETYRRANSNEEASEASKSFDEYLYKLAENKTLYSLLQMLNVIISRDRKYSSVSEERRNEIYTEHIQIIKALEQKNLEGVKEAISKHIHNGRQFIEQK